MFVTNLSQKAREITKTGKAVFKDVGDLIGDCVWDEFMQLVMETPQWTGTAAASWDIATRGRRYAGGGAGATERPSRSREDALFMGHDDAVDIALSRNHGALDGLGDDYRYMDIFITNSASSAEFAESGPLRPVNMGGLGALKRFEDRVQNHIFAPIKDYII